jgi:hypothetical protein
VSNIDKTTTARMPLGITRGPHKSVHPSGPILLIGKKEDRKTARSAAKWVQAHVNDMDWGQKEWNFLDEAYVPKHRNTKQLLLSFLTRVSSTFPNRLSQKLLIKHFVGQETLYFTGSRGDQTLVMVDIDCHKSGTPEGARRFAEYLRANFFPNLYFETSTNGNGIHGYLIVDKWEWSAADYNATLKLVELWLKRILASTSFDVETVELKGRCAVVIWDRNCRYRVEKFTMGGLAKIPRDWKRFDEWQATTQMTGHELADLPVKYPVESVPEVEIHVKKQEAGASIRGKLIDKERMQNYLPLAQRFVPVRELVSRKSRVWVTAEDMAIFLVLLEFFGENPNEDGSMPYKRFKVLWDRLYKDGDVARAFDNKRFAWLRNRVSQRGGIEWQDATYCENRAAKWKASGQLLELLFLYSSRPRKLSGSRAPEIESLWEKMPLENAQNVGLRPVLVIVKEKKWNWLDHWDELEALGLGCMAA